MYEQFFNLNVKPFELVPNPDFLFLSRSHKRALTHLDYGIKERIGFILLTGEVGSGKTTIIRNQIKELNGRVTVSKIFNTKVTSEQLISMVNEDFGLEVTGKDKVTLLRELNDFLIKQYADKCHPILIIDEAQNLTPDLLEEVRMLSNLETDKCKLLQIILVGQPELRRTIAQPELRQLRQRISISCHISPLTRKEMQEYIFHRLKIAGNSEAISFSDKTFNIIYDFSRGIPRLVNIICDFLLLSAFVEGTRELSPELVQEVIRELEREHKYWQDETLEKLFLGNEENAAPPATSQDGAFLKISRKNFLRIIQEMVNRMVKLEEDFAKSYLSES
jgi:general secretion pathway protein A